ncbi:MAG TPA: hypothetical protein VGM91_00410 [Conexibacter sp.]
MPARRCIVAAALAALAVPAAPLLVPTLAQAGRPGVWTPITSADGDNIDQVGLLRADDRSLHVAWTRKTPGDSVMDDLMQTTITPQGVARPAQTIASGWVGIGSPSLARAGDGSLLLAAGATQTSDLNAIDSIAAWRSADGGGSWSAPVRPTMNGGFADDPEVAFGSDGTTPFIGVGTTFGLFVHPGLDPATADGNFQSAAGWACCGYSPGLARDSADGRMVVAWSSNATGHVGVFAQQVDQASGAPIGAPSLMPGSVTSYGGQQQADYSLAHTPIVGRSGRPGVYVAYAGGYPSTRRVLVWQYGAKKSTTVANVARGVKTVGIASTQQGRLWAFWSSGNRVYASRSTTGGLVWGAVTSTPARKGTVSVFHLAGDAQDGLLDLLGAFGTAASRAQTWHTQLQAGLTLKLARASVGGKKNGPPVAHVKLRVTDAGDPVANAKVSLSGKHATTSGKGTVTLAVPARARLTATAAHDGYADATATLRVPLP